MRLLLDTSAAISGLLWHGTPGKLIDAAIEGPHLLGLVENAGISIVTPAEVVERLRLLPSTSSGRTIAHVWPASASNPRC